VSRALPLLVLVLAACRTAPPGGPSVSPYRSEAMTAVRRLLVLPFTPESEFPDQAEMVTARFVQYVRCGSFTVVPLPEATFADALVEDVRLRGAIRAEDLIRLEKEYRVDAVALGTVTRYDPYAPQVLGLSVQVLSTRTGAVLWSCQKVFDASSPQVADDALRWYDRDVEETGAEFGPEVVLLSPKAFARYACARLAESLVAETKVARRDG
jgi:hypothetical protein